MTILGGDWYERFKKDNSARGLDVSMCAKVNLDNLAFVAYSSGTTGKPKGVCCFTFRKSLVRDLTHCWVCVTGARDSGQF